MHHRHPRIVGYAAGKPHLRVPPGFSSEFSSPAGAATRTPEPALAHQTIIDYVRTHRRQAGPDTVGTSETSGQAWASLPDAVNEARDGNLFAPVSPLDVFTVGRLLLDLCQP